MKRIFLTGTLALVCAASALAQTHKAQTSTSATSNTNAQASARNVELASGTHLAGQLQNALDVRRAHVGDQVVLKTTEAVKQNGHTVVNKGARLIGHVTDVQQRTKDNATSSIGLVFDRLESGSLSTPITATITSITQASAHTSASNDDLMNDTSASNTTTTSGGSSGGGLLGGVGNTVGSTVGGVTNTVGGVVNTTTQATGQVVSGTTNAVGHTVNGLHISQSGSASAEGGSTLSLTGGNLRLEKNTTFNLTLNESAAVGHERDDREQ